MRELKEQKIKIRREQYFNSDTDHYFNYAITGKYTKRASLKAESKRHSKLVTEQAKKKYEKRNTIAPDNFVDLSTTGNNPFDVVKEEESDFYTGSED